VFLIAVQDKERELQQQLAQVSAPSPMNDLTNLMFIV
jgi:hypothetical protein